MSDPQKADEPATAPSPRAERTLDAGALRALAHPLRVEIYDIITQYGPQTASSLAAMTGESSGATSYHLRALAKHDLIREMEGHGTGRERWWERPRGGISFTNQEVMKTPSGRAATQVVMHEFLTRRHLQLMRYVNESLIDAENVDPEEAMISTAIVRLTKPQIIELMTRLQDVVNDVAERYRDQNVEGARPMTIRADLFPLPQNTESTHEGGAT